jgi:DNA-binding CsgD family transcriptional regulator
MKSLVGALESAADGAIVVDEQLEIVYANRAAKRILGKRLDVEASIRCYQLLQGRDDHDRLVCWENCEIAKKLLTGGRVSSFDVQVETRPEESRWINVSVFCYADPQAEKPYIFHLFRDITQKKKEVRLVERLVEVARNYHRIPSEIPPSRESSRLHESLTRREREVLSLLAQGTSTSEIGQALTISVNTARNHIQNILEKLGVHTRLEAVIYAIDHNLVGQAE